MKEKERFISIDDSGESIFTFDEADMIIDAKTNIVYGANNIPDLVKILNSQSLQWQKLKEILKRQIDIDSKEYLESGFPVFKNYVTVENFVLQKMQELEGEDDKD